LIYLHYLREENDGEVIWKSLTGLLFLKLMEIKLLFWGLMPMGWLQMNGQVKIRRELHV
jgi:hypothetical protein